MDITAFITARLDEDERIARESETQCWRSGFDDKETLSYALVDSEGEPVVYDEGRPAEGETRHMARHDPARVLREVEAKRAIVDWCRRMDPYPGMGGLMAAEARRIVRWLAATWADHPDYDPAWAR